MHCSWEAKCTRHMDSWYVLPSAQWAVLTLSFTARCKQNLGKRASCISRCLPANLAAVQHIFLNYHGERGARIHRDDSVLEETIYKRRSWLFRLVTPFLFFMPSVYMKEIEHVWIDDTVDYISWRRFIQLLYKDWQQAITPVCPCHPESLRML